ncbi:MAG: hypothetical protein IT204_16690 [Fimbriimonadaceae bacterium]|nr:hypothetical protein [Fimbriimonadaceae bacterium]
MSDLPGTELLALPATWTWVVLGSIAEVKLGKMLSEAAYAIGLAQLPYLRNQNVRWFGIDDGDLKMMGFADHERERFAVRTGDLLVCEGGEPGRCAVVPEHLDGLMYQKALHRVRPCDGVLESRFLQYMLRHFVDSGIAVPRMSETTIQHLPLEKVLRLPVVVAPANEQRRIADKLDELFSQLDAGVAALERVQANLKRYRAAVLKAAVAGDLTREWRAQHPEVEPASVLLERILAERRRQWEAAQLAKFEAQGKRPPANWRAKYEEAAPPDTTGLPELPQGWCWASVAQIGAVQGGIQKQPKRAPKSNAYPYLRVANVLRDRLDLSVMEAMELFGGELERLRLEAGDLLIVEGNGSRDQIGRSAVWTGKIGNCVHQNHIIRVRPRCGSPAFLNLYWNSPLGAGRVFDVAASTSGLYTLSVSKVMSLPVAVPPEAEQAIVVAEAERLLAAAEHVERLLSANGARAARLRQSILKQAFEGKLVPQDPSDEPAEKLLERIAAARGQAPPKARRPRERRPGEQSATRDRRTWADVEYR